MELAQHSDPDLTLNVYAHSRLEELGRVWTNCPRKCGQDRVNPLTQAGRLKSRGKPVENDAGNGDTESAMWAKMWASDRLCDFAHALPTSGVSGGTCGTVENKPEMRPGASRQARENPPFELPGQDSNLEKQDQNLL